MSRNEEMERNFKSFIASQPSMLGGRKNRSNKKRFQNGIKPQQDISNSIPRRCKSPEGVVTMLSMPMSSLSEPSSPKRKRRHEAVSATEIVRYSQRSGPYRQSCNDYNRGGPRSRSVDCTSSNLSTAHNPNELLPMQAREASLANVPEFLMLEIMSFMHNDRSALVALRTSCKAACTLSRSDIVKHMRRNISEKRNDVMCNMCCGPLTYPYRLVDCNHVVCGKCAYHRANPRIVNGSCDCGVEIHSQPVRLGHEADRLAESVAGWLLSPKTNSLRRKQHEERVHQGTYGAFGKQVGKDPFDGVGFKEDFDDLPSLHISSNFESILPATTNKLELVHCSAQNNYVGDIVHEGTTTELQAQVRRPELWRGNVERDDELLLNEARDWDDEDSEYDEDFEDDKKFSYRLIGWKDLLYR